MHESGTVSSGKNEMETGRGGVVHALSVPRVATPPTVAGKKLDPKCDLYNLYRRDGAGRISTSNNFINYVSVIDHAGDGNDSGGQSAPCILACTGKGVTEGRGRGGGPKAPSTRCLDNPVASRDTVQIFHTHR